ncbi:MAG: hypothetical protein ACPHGZ_06520 [Schleiferiaceae bacterium]
MKPQRVVLWITAFFVAGISIGLSFRESVSFNRGSSMDRFFQYLQDEYVDTLDIPALQQEAMASIHTVYSFQLKMSSKLPKGCRVRSLGWAWNSPSMRIPWSSSISWKADPRNPMV